MDLDYSEDSRATADANFVLSKKNGIIEIQISGEKRPISKSEFDKLLKISEDGIRELFQIQEKFISEKKD